MNSEHPPQGTPPAPEGSGGDPRGAAPGGSGPLVPAASAPTGQPDQLPVQPGEAASVAQPPAQGVSPAYAAPPEWVETEPLEYHQLLRGVPKYRWWKPLLALVLAGIYYLTLSVVYTFVVLVPYFLITGAELTEEALFALALPDTQQPISLVVSLGSVALMIPAVWFALWSTGLTPVGRGWSVALRIRWRLLARTLVPAFVTILVMNVLGIALELAFSLFASEGGEADLPAVAIDPTLALWSALIILLLVPIQATAEELVFRGLFMQVLGGWCYTRAAVTVIGRFLRGPWIPIAVPSIIFGFAHIYDVWGWLAVVALAITAGWVTWRTGGLEAAISIHVINNWIAFGFMLFAFGGETGQTESGAGLGSLIGQVAGLVLYVWWIERVFARTGGIRTRIDLVRPRSARGHSPSAEALR